MNISLHAVTPCTCFQVIFLIPSLLCAACKVCVTVRVFLPRYGMTTIRARGAFKFAPLIAQVRGLEGLKVCRCNPSIFPVAC